MDDLKNQLEQLVPGFSYTIKEDKLFIDDRFIITLVDGVYCLQRIYSNDTKEGRMLELHLRRALIIIGERNV